MAARSKDRTCTETAMRVVLIVDALARDQRPYLEVVNAVRLGLDLGRAQAYRYVATASDVLGLCLVRVGASNGALKVVRNGAR